VHSNPLNKALCGPPAQPSLAGFVFLGARKFGRREEMNVNFEKGNGLVPAIIQDEQSGDVLMLGFMNADSLEQTQRFAALLAEKGIRHELDVWGEDTPHDWPAWRAQIAHHLPRFA